MSNQSTTDNVSERRRQRLYFNDGQLRTYLTSARHTYIVAARRFGKSTILGPTLLRNVLNMPKGVHAIVGLTYKQMLTRTLPATIAAIEKWGFKRNVHFYVGRRAPEKALFPNPIIDPVSYDYCIHFANGAVVHLISQDVKYSSNSYSLDSVIIDEAKTINYDKLKSETIPAVSGTGLHRSCVWEKSITAVTDMPTNRSGYWILEKEKDMDVQLIQLIHGIISEIQYYKSIPTPSEYEGKQLSILRRTLADARRHATYYAEFDALDNIAVLGMDYIHEQQRNLSPLEFRTSILNMRITRTNNAFYASLDPLLHYYNKSNNDFFNSRFRNAKQDIIIPNDEDINTSLSDGDINNELPLMIALDYNANINWLVVAQADYDTKTLYTIKSFYVKKPRMIRELIADFAAYYATRSNRDVIYYHDNTALQGAYAISTGTFADEVESQLAQHNFQCARQYIGQAPHHHVKHRHIDLALKGQDHLFPRFNHQNNEALMIGMESAGTRIGSKGFEKDKSREKLPDLPEDPVELRTDGTDAWDTLFWGAVFHAPAYINSSFVSSL